MSSDKPRFSRAVALDVARQLLPLQDLCERFVFVGSLRRRKKDVGDIEVLYIPRVVEVEDPEDLFGKKVKRSAVDLMLEHMIAHGQLAKRERVNGGTMWGEQNKFARHPGTGLPIDFFAATHQNWWNLLVCRTGGAQSNIEVAEGARVKGWRWDPYSAGFRRKSRSREGWDDIHPVHSEREVFEFVAMDFREPWERQ